MQAIVLFVGQLKGAMFEVGVQKRRIMQEIWTCPSKSLGTRFPLQRRGLPGLRGFCCNLSRGGSFPPDEGGC